MIQAADQQITKIQHDGSVVLATASSRTAVRWQNKDMLWSDLIRKLSTTTRTPETFAEYRKMPKSQQDQAKDVGGFVGGSLKGGRRKADSVAWRQIVTLDADYVTGDLWSIVQLMFGNACAIYSTHSHSPDKPRIRLVFPLARTVSPEEYVAVAKRVAADIGIDHFDDTTYQPHRLMYWPSTSSDGDYVFEYQDADWLDPDTVLARYTNWRDPLEWPTSSRQQQERVRLAERQGDPLTKPGMVGAFCRAYDIESAIETFLADRYERFGEGRYTYKEGTTAGGLVLYEGKFAYSHHGTDPISSQLVNSFDLVRIHLFGAMDDDAKPGTPISRMPSTIEMTRFAQNDDVVKQMIVADRLDEAFDDFGDEGGKVESTDWMKKLNIKKDGSFEDSRTNQILILENDPNLKGKFKLNEFAQRAVVVDDLPWRKKSPGSNDFFNDYDDAGLRNYLDRVYGISSVQKTQDALAQVFLNNSYHPIRDYLNGLKWDGVERVDTLLIDVLGARDTELNRAVTRKTLVAAVARVFNPGCKMDYMLTLTGAQGLGKSSLFGKLGGEWFSDSLTTVNGKEAYEQVQGAWIVEMGELSATRKAEVEATKQFLTKRVDRFRVAYGRHVTDFPRQCVFIGTTNDREFLRDQTGNRRFWVVSVGGGEIKKPWNEISREEINQIWAEAVVRYRDGEELYLSKELEDQMYDVQKDHFEESPLFGVIEEHLNKLVPKNFNEMTLSERKLFFEDPFDSDFGGLIERDRVCSLEVWVECLNGRIDRFPMVDRREINSILRRMPGWEDYGSTLLFNTEIGKQRAFIRATKSDF